MMVLCLYSFLYYVLVVCVLKITFPFLLFILIRIVQFIKQGGHQAISLRLFSFFF